MPERTFTTHDIARFCDVYPSSVVHWINNGRLKSYQTAGGHHRVTKGDLLAFLQELHIPIPLELVESKRVLIVDDDVEVARVVERALGRLPGPLKTEVCHDGVEALIRIGQEPPDLVILDIVLPQMDGVQVCRVLKAKAETRNIKIIAITGRMPGERKVAEMRIDAIFAKPLDLAELVEKSGELLGVRRPAFRK